MSCYFFLQLPESRISKTTNLLSKQLVARGPSSARVTRGGRVLREIPASATGNCGHYLRRCSAWKKTTSLRNSSYHEETYYYRLRPSDGFAIQRIYTRDTDLDVALPVHDGDVVLIHEGYHPVVKAPSTNAYYLNFLAGDVRKISAVNVRDI
jgi:hypothetical protein